MKKPSTPINNTPVNTPFIKPTATATTPLSSSSSHRKAPSPQQSQQSLRKRRVSFGKPQAKGKYQNSCT